MPFKVAVLGAGGQLVLRVPGDSIEVWELKKLLVAPDAAPHLIAVTRFELYHVDGDGGATMLDAEQAVGPAIAPFSAATVKVTVKLNAGACVVACMRASACV